MDRNRYVQSNYDSLALFTLDERVPKDHLIRDINEFIDWKIIYEIRTLVIIEN